MSSPGTEWTRSSICSQVRASYPFGLPTSPGTSTNLVLVPGIIVGLLFGRWLVHRVPQRLFNQLLLAFAALAALRLIGVL